MRTSRWSIELIKRTIVGDQCRKKAIRLMSKRSISGHANQQPLQAIEDKSRRLAGEEIAINLS
jgi:hypothetical protein